MKYCSAGTENHEQHEKKLTALKNCLNVRRCYDIGQVLCLDSGLRVIRRLHEQARLTAVPEGTI